MTYGRFTFYGVGGGWDTPRKVAFFASTFMPDATVVLVDGGVYSLDQRDHESFHVLGNKARVQAEWLQREFPALDVIDVPMFVGFSSSDRTIAIQDVMLSGDVVFLQVDNNRTRLLVEQYARELQDITLICGGTNGDQLRVMVYLRRNGADLTPPFSSYCEAVAHPQDESPVESREGCFEKVARAAQQPFTMLSASTFQCNAFCEVWKRESAGTLARFPYHELWFDIGTGRCRTEIYPL
ncbi:hypothetical protein HY634_04450 [Candidatus Uhrbacteria bacterium]|nr:hypothetical protein [Candidatus Uhrbacteria bacterium]